MGDTTKVKPSSTPTIPLAPTITKLPKMTTAETKKEVSAMKRIMKKDLGLSKLLGERDMMNELLRQYDNLFNVMSDDELATMFDRTLPYSIDDALKLVNPNYSPISDEYSNNCQRCAVTYELLRRGFNVTALPYWTRNDPLPFCKVMDKMLDGKGNWKTATSITMAENIVRLWGAGARGFVRVDGHIFNVENVGGKPVFVEGQNGKRYDSAGVARQFGRGGYMKLFRVDNINFDGAVKYYAKGVNK